MAQHLCLHCGCQRVIQVLFTNLSRIELLRKIGLVNSYDLLEYLMEHFRYEELIYQLRTGIGQINIGTLDPFKKYTHRKVLKIELCSLFLILT